MIIKEANQIKAMEPNKDRTSGRETTSNSITILNLQGIQITNVTFKIQINIFLVSNKISEVKVLMLNLGMVEDTLIITPHQMKCKDKICLSIITTKEEITIKILEAMAK